jgi:hypothetical protein
MDRTTCLIAVPLCLLAFGAGPPTTAPALDDLLRGPTVPDTTTRTLVITDANGSFVPLQERPEEVALERALVDPDRRHRAREAIAARATALGLMLVEKIDRVKEATDAIRSEDRDTAQAIYRELHAHFDADRMRDPLMDDFDEILSPSEAGEVTRLVDEYWDAWIEWELRNVEVPGPAARERTERRLAFVVFQRELREAYNWTLRPFQSRLELLYEVAKPDDEQRAEIRMAIIDHIREARLEATPEQRRRTADRIYSILSSEQRRALFEHVLWRR